MKYKLPVFIITTAVLSASATQWCTIVQADTSSKSKKSKYGIAAESRASLTPHIKSVKVLRESGGRVSWSAKNNLIAFDRQGKDRLYDLFTMNPDGSGEKCLTCGKPGINQGQNGQPEWHPSGEYIVFQSEKKKHRGNHHDAGPGFGGGSELWLTDKDGKQFWQLTFGPKNIKKTYAVLHPHFSEDGTMLSWSEAYHPGNLFKPGQLIGYWKLKVADFSIGPDGPKLNNIREYEPGGPGFYENHGFSHDGNKLIYTSNFAATKMLELNANDIYVTDLRDGKPVLLADEGYNEHAIWSPNGNKIVWMCNVGNKNGGTDYWLMNSDGSNKTRLTNFNLPKHPITKGQALTCADFAWSPDGKRLVSYIQKSLISGQGMIVLIELADHIAMAVGEQSVGYVQPENPVGVTFPSGPPLSSDDVPANSMTSGKKQFANRLNGSWFAWFMLSSAKKKAALKRAKGNWNRLSDEEKAWWNQINSDWQKHSPKEKQAVFQALQDTWDSLSAEQKAWFTELGKKWNKLNPEERAAKQAEWKAAADKFKHNGENLTPKQEAWWEQQGQAWKSNWSDWKALSPEEKSAKQAQWNEAANKWGEAAEKWKKYWDSIPPEQKAKWKAQGEKWKAGWNAQSPEEKRKKQKAFEEFARKLQKNKK